MMRRISKAQIEEASGPSKSRRWLAALLGALVLLSATPSLADEYDSSEGGHPVRIIAYVLHPVGVALEYLILRPAHWIGSREPFKTVFGHED